MAVPSKNRGAGIKRHSVRVERVLGVIFEGLRAREGSGDGGGRDWADVTDPKRVAG